MFIKIRHIYLPFLIIGISFISLYTFLYWFIFIKLHLNSLNEEFVCFILPAGLSGLLIFIALTPRMKVLELRKSSENLFVLFHLLAVLAIAISTAFSVSYIESACGKLTTLDNIQQIGKKPITKYYALKSYFIDKSNPGISGEFNVGGKNNSDLNMSLYIALPILTREAATSDENCLAWMGVTYYKRISNKLSPDEKERSYQAFARESLKDLEKKDLNQFVYLSTLGNTAERTGLKDAVSKGSKYHSQNPLIFGSVNEPFENRNGNNFTWIFLSFASLALIWFGILLSLKLDEDKVKKIEGGRPVEVPEQNFFLEFLTFKSGYIITPVLLYLNIVIFFLMVFGGYGFDKFHENDLIGWGADFAPSTLNGEWWRLLTSMFLHAGFGHLLNNMIGLFMAGVFLEPFLSKAKFLIGYLFSGVLAGYACLWWHEIAFVAVGASGAIFGLYGLLFSLMLTRIIPSEAGVVVSVLSGLFVGYNLVMELWDGAINVAHVGGLLAGFVYGLILYPILKNSDFGDGNLIV